MDLARVVLHSCWHTDLKVRNKAPPVMEHLSFVSLVWDVASIIADEKKTSRYKLHLCVCAHVLMKFNG